jgi:hypothetical protein
MSASIPKFAASLFCCHPHDTEAIKRKLGPTDLASYKLNFARDLPIADRLAVTERNQLVHNTRISKRARVAELI